MSLDKLDEGLNRARIRRRADALADSPIQKDIPVPPKRNGPKSPWKEKFSRMEVGDSFFVANIKRCTAATRYAGELGIKITYRRVGNGIRFWRTE